MDFDARDAALVRAVRPYTLTSPERIVALAGAVRWIVEEKIPGAFVECGVWRGGSMMAVARTLLEQGVRDRDLHLFDTFEGMTEPEPEDRDPAGRPAARTFRRMRRLDETADWCRAGEDDVRTNMAGTGYPSKHVHLVKGRVEDTLPAAAPEEVALLRLDTDWYASTRHELVHLWPSLVSGGICVADDYGHWAGHRRAIDEYLEEQGVRVLMHRSDYPGRLFVKP
ncbi:class I SAM-dependent methyltransferase [Frankia sp. CNm7]|uniref:Class I SAM-dependent methyltransferase n=1 Tax=Frankia nepalensis TaxID=1836974 RepID=A0A937USY8_9ACTN|nr:TylF/MycF/NovP-related O-methyltransferase [Frankia nepalensis]MBL7497378.1 class I SAM-dependent methyltransferase [Frankia nepalensis]MBL7512768.1 class I SAM-dependent methyltransferase [Frankia nepalensis]MBL7522514.1 class I SAM-dependent methyltransferase [Frankia nepalensis]MBL7629416.1 class I SAM-dependent methyltransferase [Frankia nepalensis]